MNKRILIGLMLVFLVCAGQGVFGETISYGSEYVFNSSGSTTRNTISNLDSTHFVVSYNDAGNSSYGTAVIGTVATDGEISYGLEYVFQEYGSLDIFSAVLDSEHFVVVYIGESNDAYARIGTITGNSISYGSEYEFDTAQLTNFSVLSIDSNRFVIVYRDPAGTEYGRAIIGTVATDGEISYGSEYEFNGVTVAYTSLSLLDSTHFVVVYQDDGGADYGIARIGIISNDDEIAFGSEYVFLESTSRYMATFSLDSTHFGVVYTDVDNNNYGVSVIGTVSDGNIISYGSKYVFNEAYSLRMSVSLLDSTNFVVAYTDFGNSGYGTAVIGTVSDGNVIAYGDINVFNEANTSDNSVSLLNPNHFVTAYRDEGNATRGTAIIGTVTYDHDFITTCNWTSTGTYTLRAYRGSNTDVVTSYSLWYRKKGDATWIETTNGEVVIASTGEWEIGNDWNKSGNDALTHSYYGITDIDECTAVEFDEVSLGATVGAYFLYSCWKNCSSLTSMPVGFTIPTGITTVGAKFLLATWDGCTSLTSMPSGFNIPTGITGTVGASFLSGTWDGCTSLTSMPSGFNIPSGITAESNNFFSDCWKNCSSLTSMPSGFQIPSGITTADDGFFHSTWNGCSSLTSMPDGFQIPTGITSVGDYFFRYCWYGCSSLTSMPSGFQIPTGITTADDLFFEHCWSGCSSLTSMPSGFQIPTGITTADDMFFEHCWSGCSSLASMPAGFDIPSGITSVGSNFFTSTWDNCTALDNDDYTEPITFEFTTGTNTFGGTCPITADSPIVGTKETPVEVEVNRPIPPNNAPTLASVDLNEYYGKTGDTIKITANTPADGESDSLSLYCHTSSGASSSNTAFCSDTGNASPYTDVSCVGTAVAGDGNHTIYCVLSDGTADSTEYTDIYASDNTAPTTTDDHTDGWLATPYYFTLSPSDSGSGISSTAFRVNSGDWNSNTIIWVVTDGNYQIDYNSIDTVGNVEVTNTIWSALDSTAPINGSIVITDTAGYTTDNTPALTLFAEDTDSGMKEMAFSCNNANWSAWETYATSFSTFNVETGEGCSAGNGVKTIYVKYRDNLDTESASVNDSTTLDTTAPINGSITITDTAGYTKDVTPTLTLFAEDTHSGMKEMAFSCNDAAWSGWTAYGVSHTTFNIETGAGCSVGDGATTVYTKFRDNLDTESASVNDSTYYDTTDPTTTITGCDMSDWNSTDQNCRLTCTDAGSGCGTIYWQIDSGGWYSESVSDTTTFLINTDGNHDVEFYSVDPLINTETHQTVWVSIDNTAPTTTSAGYTSYNWTADSTTVTLNCSDSHTACASTQYRLDSNPASGTTMGAWQAYTIPFDITTDGNWAIDFNSTDTLGNTETPNREIILVSNPVNIDANIYWESDNTHAFLQFRRDYNTNIYFDANIQTYSTIDTNALHWMVWSTESNDHNDWKYSTIGNDINGWNAMSGTYKHFASQDTNTDSDGDNWFFKYDAIDRGSGSAGYLSTQTTETMFANNTKNNEDLNVWFGGGIYNFVKIRFDDVHVHLGEQTTYAVDVNAQFFSATPAQQIIHTFDCNSDYTNGTPIANPNCFYAGSITSDNNVTQKGNRTLYYTTDASGAFSNGMYPSKTRYLIFGTLNDQANGASISAITSDDAGTTEYSHDSGTTWNAYSGTPQIRMRYIHEEKPVYWKYFFTYHIVETGTDYNFNGIFQELINTPTDFPPSIAFIDFNSNWQNGLIDINGLCFDENSDLAKIDLNLQYLDGSTAMVISDDINCVFGAWGITFDSSSVADGNYILFASITDIHGTTSTRETPAAFDNTPPTVSWDKNSLKWYKENQTITLTCTDNNSACRNITYRIDTNGFDGNTTNAIAWTAYTAAFTVVVDGNYQVDFNATDILGNVQTDWNYQYLLLDKTNPTLSDQYPLVEVLTGNLSTPTFSVKVTDANAFAEFSQAKGCWIDVYKNSALVAQNQYDTVDANGYCEYTFSAFPLSEDHWGYVKFKGTDFADNNSATLTTATYNHNEEITGGGSPPGGGGGATIIEEISQLLFSIIAPSPDKTIYVVLPKNSTKTVTITLENDLTDRTVQITPSASVALQDFVDFDTQTLNLDSNGQGKLTATFSWAENYSLESGSQTIDGIFLFTTESKQETIPVRLVLAEENIIDMLRNLLKANLLLAIILIMLGLATAIIPNTMDINTNIKSLAAVIGIIFTITIIALYLI